MFDEGFDGNIASCASMAVRSEDAAAGGSLPRTELAEYPSLDYRDMRRKLDEQVLREITDPEELWIAEDQLMLGE